MSVKHKKAITVPIIGIGSFSFSSNYLSMMVSMPIGRDILISMKPVARFLPLGPNHRCETVVKELSTNG
jgi:hypothetical protein